MTKETKTTSDIDPSKTSQNGKMLTVAIFDNVDYENKKKLVFDCQVNEVSSLIDAALASGKKKWEANKN